MRFLHRLGTVLATSLLYAAVSSVTVLPASAEKRIALVVGNSAYRNVPPLTNPVNDAKLIADTLQSLGFELVGGSAQLDLDKPSFEAIVKHFGTLMRGAEVGLFYYAGHGVQVRGANYLVPVSANPEREADVDFEMLDTALVMRQMEGAGTRLNLIILDACRNNPFGARASRGTSRGLAQMEAPEGTLISFATQPGNVASDGEEGNSPYTKALAQTVKRPGLGIFDVFNQVGLEVKKQTGGSQQPWVSSSPITGSFYFSGSPVAQPAPLATAPAPAEQPDEAEKVWNTIQNTTSIAVIERFIEQFPTSSYGDIARARLDELKKNQMSALTAPAPMSLSDGHVGIKVTRYSNMDARGNDAEWVRGIESVEQCESLCLADAVCAGFTYNIKYTTCIPKTAIGALSPSADPAITGVVERRTGGVHDETAGGSGGTKVTRYSNMDAPGNDAKWVHGIASVDECENICLTDASCAGYTYNVNKTTCIPKTAIGSLTPTHESAITGVVNQRQNGSMAPVTRPSFDCRKARTAEERAICASQPLSRLDSELANRYRVWIASHSGAAASVSQHHQNEFLAARKKCGANTSCLEEIYRQRIGDFFGQPQSRQFDETPFPAGQSARSTTQNRAIKIEGKPSFDCHKAYSETAQAICGSTNLIQLDLQLAQLFWAKMAKLKGASAEEEKRRQYDWGVLRNQCGADIACVEQSYQRRIAELGGKTSLLPAPQAPVQRPQQIAIPQPWQPQPPNQQAPQQKVQPEAEARPKGPIATVQQLPNPIRLIGQADQPCDVASATLARLRKTLSVSVPDGLTVQAEQLRSVTWKTSGAPPLGPAYLVLAANAPVRVQGTGFYALTPEAKAPFRIKQFVKQTRVIIPLHVKGEPQSGEVKIRPLIAGPLKISAAIIGYTQCGENPDPVPIAFDMTVEPGAPEIVIADRFDLAKPDEIIASPDGTRRIELYSPRYRLIDVVTGALLADEIGREPRFSPTGRFVIARAENAFEIRDTIDGEFVQRQKFALDIAWDNSDSFIVPGDQNGGVSGELIDTLQAATIAQWGVDKGPNEHAVQVSSFKTDLENNIAIGGATSSGAGSLTISETFDGEDGPGPASVEKYKTVENFVKQLSQVVSLVKPNSWDMIDGLKLTHIDTVYWNKRKGDADKRFAAALNHFVVRSIIIPPDEGRTLPINNDRLHVASRSLDPIDLPETTRLSHWEQRLRDFGIEINHGIRSINVDNTRVLKAIGGARNKAFEFLEDTKIRITTEGAGDCGKAKRTTAAKLELLISPDVPIEVAQIQAADYRLTLFTSMCVGAQDFWTVRFLHDSRRPGQLVDMDKVTKTGESHMDDCQALTKGCAYEAELFYNRYLVIWSREDFTVSIYDTEAQEIVRHYNELPSPDVMNRTSLSKDQKSLMKLDKDGGFQIIDLHRARKDTEGQSYEYSQDVPVLLSGRIVDDEVVVWTPSGQFDSTLEGASHVALRFPGRRGEYTLDQFHKLFHENDLLKRALAGHKFEPPVVKAFPPSIAVKPAFTADSVAAKIEILGDDPVDEVRVYQDGLMTNVVPVTAGAKTIDVSAKRLPGARWVAFLARGPSGLFAQPVTFDAGSFPGARRRVHIVSVGIDHYDDNRIQQLRFAGSDAERFLKSLQDKAGTSVEIVSQTLLRDAEASREAIFAKLNQTIAKAEPGDSILLFIAGHGVQAADKNYYLATSVTRVDNIEHTSLRWSDLSSALAKAHSRIAVFLDTCNSGAAGTDFFAPNDASVSALLDRAPSGILIFSASKGRELSEESADHGGGVFTSSVIAALSDPKTDRNHNGVIEASELYASVKRAVVEATEGRQTPWFARNDMVGDFIPF